LPGGEKLVGDLGRKAVLDETERLPEVDLEACGEVGRRLRREPRPLGGLPSKLDDAIGIGVQGDSSFGARNSSERTRYSVAISLSFVLPSASFAAIRWSREATGNRLPSARGARGSSPAVTCGDIRYDVP